LNSLDLRGTGEVPYNVYGYPVSAVVKNITFFYLAHEGLINDA